MDRKRFTFEIPWPSFRKVRPNHLLPTPGNVIFTLLMIGLLVTAQSVGALPLGRQQAMPPDASTNTIAYQGRLADAGGAPLTGTYSIIFRLYTAASGGAPLWEEQWTGTNGVRVSDGLFNVMLGSLTSIPQAVVTDNSVLWLGITVGTDDEMAPRVQLGSVPFAVQALTVPDNSVTTAKIADASITTSKMPDGSVTTAKLRPDTGQVGTQSNVQVTMPAQPWTRVDVPQMKTTLSLAKSTRLLVWFSATGYAAGTAHSLDLILQVNDVDFFVSSSAVGPDNTTFNIGGARMFDVPAGTHELKLQVQSGLANEVLTFVGGRVNMMYLAVSP